ncbi:calcium-responsive transcription factor-like [Haliotis cracherodii]|uniref:calcium-responsive transcription factor-like n=1 Tax=Haliotis cracherodii TaxID=6455 RepID=UPI0039E8C248
MTKDDGVSSSSDVVVVGIPVVSSGNIDGSIIDLPLTAISKAEISSEIDVASAGFVNNSFLGSVRTDNATLQSLLAAPITTPQILANPDTIQIITVPTAADLITTSQPDGAGKVWQVIPNINNPEIATIIAVSDPSELLQHMQVKPDTTDGMGQFDAQFVSTADSAGVTCSTDNLLMPPPQPPPQALPPDCPTWAARLKNCERIGDSYRGYVESEVELDLLLTFHKQQTQSFWGTRQSPSPAKPSTRLMWKSQYVPFDGIPFVNAGSRAVVQECQYGPRRKGNPKKQLDIPIKGEYRQTCPARIYIKKVRKFPEFYVSTTLDKKSLKIAMDKAFQDLKDRGVDGWGQERYYVQLPTEKAHEFHEDVPQPPKLMITPAKLEFDDTDSGEQRLHPRVVQKIREMVSAGETRVYAIRKQLRVFVVKELCHGGETPERHDLTLFPTVNDLKNHIHQALKDIENGSLPLTASTVNVEIITNQDGTSTSSLDPHGELQSFDPSILSGVAPGEDGPMPETVTVTLTQNPGEDGHHIISRIETHLSDGTTQVSTTLTPETAQLLSRLHPGMFPAGSLLQLSPMQGPTTAQEMGSSQDIVVGSAMGDDAEQNCDDMETSQNADALDGTTPLHIVDTQIIHNDDCDDEDEGEDMGNVDTSQLEQAHMNHTQMHQTHIDQDDLDQAQMAQAHLEQTHMIAVSSMEDEHGLVHLTTATSHPGI